MVEDPSNSLNAYCPTEQVMATNAESVEARCVTSAAASSAVWVAAGIDPPLPASPQAIQLPSLVRTTNALLAEARCVTSAAASSAGWAAAGIDPP